MLASRFLCLAACICIRGTSTQGDRNREEDGEGESNIIGGGQDRGRGEERKKV